MMSMIDELLSHKYNTLGKISSSYGEKSRHNFQGAGWSRGSFRSTCTTTPGRPSMPVKALGELMGDCKTNKQKNKQFFFLNKKTITKLNLNLCISESESKAKAHRFLF